MPPTIAVLGLGYAGLPVALALGRRYPGTLAYDVDSERLARLAAGEDPAAEFSPRDLEEAGLVWTDDPAALGQAGLYILCVPTPIDADRRPRLDAVLAAAETVGRVLSPGDVVVLQSTVYPGVTEEVLGPALGRASGLAPGVDFHLGYAPERINPGDAEHAFERVVKVVAAPDGGTLGLLREVYGAVVEAGVYPLTSIRVAETAKLIENVQRDLNIALMNELSRICHALDIDTAEVLDAAATKWNFHRYHPGLVGGHCVGVDPYYLTAKAEELGLKPEVILAGRRVNHGMGSWVGERVASLLGEVSVQPRGATVAVLGAAFKPDVADARNSRVPELVSALEAAGCRVLVHEPRVDPRDLRREAGLEGVQATRLAGADAVVLAVPHRGLADLALSLVGPGQAALLADVQGAIDPAAVPPGVRLWRL